MKACGLDVYENNWSPRRVSTLGLSLTLGEADGRDISGVVGSIGLFILQFSELYSPIFWEGAF